MKRQLMRFKSAFIKDGEMWCVPTALNWIFKIDLNDWSIKSVCDLGLGEGFCVEYIFQCENSVWCVPAKGTRIVEYHMLTGNVKHYEMEAVEQRNRGAVLFNRMIWIIPIELPGEVICFDIEKKIYVFYDKWKKECLEKEIKGRVVGFCKAQNMIYMTLMDECKVICFNLETGEIRLKEFPGKFGLGCILKIQNKLYVTSLKKRMIFQWDQRTDIIKKIYCTYLQDVTYMRAMPFKDKVLLFDEKTIDIFCINTKTINLYNEITDELENEYAAPLFFDVLIYEGRFIFVPWSANVLLEYNGRDEKWRTHVLKIPEKIYYEGYVVKRLKKCLLVGEEEIGINNFVDYLRDMEDIKCGDRLQKQIGYNIYRQLYID